MFFGNSITYWGTFSQAFPAKKVANLGYPGDDLDGMIRRVEAIKAVNPDQVFVMAGINGLRDMPLVDFSFKYSRLVDSIARAVPFARIYLQSILPVSWCKEQQRGSNIKIKDANMLISNIAKSNSYTYIDLFSLYASNEVMPDSLTFDGIHLRREAYARWFDKLKSFIGN